jgi:ABC-2 type transport system permease protein
MLQRIAALVAKEFTQLRRDIFFVLLILLGPVSEMSAIAYATGQEIKHLPMAIVDSDRTAESRDLVQTLANTETFDVVAYVDSIDDLVTLLDHSTIYAAVVIPPGYARQVQVADIPAEIQVVLNGAESAAAETALKTIDGALARYSETLRPPGEDVRDLTNKLNLSVRVWYNQELREANYTIPSELGFILYVIALWIASLSIARERELGTLEQLLVTPIRRLELVIGKSIPAVVIAYLDFIFMLGMVVFVFKVPMRGSLLLLLGLALFYILVELQRGLLISAIARTQQQALLIVFLMSFIDMTFSGYAVPVESMPPILQYVAAIFPIRHWLLIMRGIMLKGAGLDVFWPHVVAIGIQGTVLLSATMLAFRQALSNE